MKKILLIILFVISINQLYSQENDGFVYVTSSKDGYMFYVLFEKENYGTKEFWLKVIKPIKSTKSKSGKIIKTGGGYSLEYIKMNCSEKEYSTSDMIIYDRNGKSERRPEYYDQYNEKVIPGSVMSGIHSYLCETE